MSRAKIRKAAGAATTTFAIAALLSAPATHADDAGVEGSVDSIIELQLDSLGSGGIAATVTTTIARTRLSTPGRGGKPATDDFSAPVTGRRIVVRTTTSAAHGAATTITLGPQGP